jgi:ADP-ribose pyrophosphatase YjhB (NUDIX family)
MNRTELLRQLRAHSPFDARERERLERILDFVKGNEACPDMLSAAWREAREESGLINVRPVLDHIFDVDVHEIPANLKEPAHLHFDIRFLFEADRKATLAVTAESKSLRWIALDEITEITREESVLRMVRKTVSVARPLGGREFDDHALPNGRASDTRTQHNYDL